MATFTGRAISPATGDDTSRLDLSGATFTGAAMNVAGSTAPFILRGGSLALTLASGPVVGHEPLSGDTWPGRIIPLITVLITGRLDTTGAVFEGRELVVSAVYRNGDRLTIAGYARTIPGQPLRQFQIHFIGETVQDHFFGAATDLNGVYVAYLDTGDTYTAYAFSPKSGITYKLETLESTPNQTNLTFRQVTKLGGFGEGIFLQGGA